MKRLLNWFERKKYSDDGGQVTLPTVIQGKFLPENRLEELLIDAGYEAAARPVFESEFLVHEVFIAIRDDGHSAGEFELSQNQGLGIYTLTDEQGHSYPVGFTALTRGYECFGPETVMARMPGRQLLETVSEAGLWMNPASSFGVLWTKHDLKRILAL